MKQTQLMYGLARVRIAGLDLTGEEVLVAPPFFERHLVAKEYELQSTLYWQTFRPLPVGRIVTYPRPEYFPTRYMFLQNTEDGRQVATDMAFGAPPFTGMIVGEPINAYVPIPFLVYSASPTDYTPVSKYGIYPDVFPYAIPVDYTEIDRQTGAIRIKTRPLFVAQELPRAQGFEEAGMLFRGSSAQIFPVTNMYIPKVLMIGRMRLDEFFAGGGLPAPQPYPFPQAMVAWSDVVRQGDAAFEPLRQTIVTIPAGEALVGTPQPRIITEVVEDPETGQPLISEIIDGRLVGVYVDWVSKDTWGNLLNSGADLRDFTFGFYVVPQAPIFQDVALLTRLSVIRVFWGGYYMIEILPQMTRFYFMKEGYTVPDDPTIPADIFRMSSVDYLTSRKRLGIFNYAFTLKYFRPVVNGPVLPPNVFAATVENMTFKWGSKGLQAGEVHDTYVIMHIRGHVCIFSYNKILRAATLGDKVEPLFAFNPLEYIYRHYGRDEALRWWRQNNYAIARADSPPKMWLFNVASNVSIPYFEFLDTAIATRPSFIVPANPKIYTDPEKFQHIKVVPSGITAQDTAPLPGGSTSVSQKIPIVLDINEEIPPELVSQEGMFYGPETNPIREGVGSLTLTRGSHRAFGQGRAHPAFVGMRVFVVPSPSPDCPCVIEQVVVDEPVKKYFIGVEGKTTEGVLKSKDILMTTVVFRTSVKDANAGRFWGEISGYLPLPHERAAGQPLIPTFDGDDGPFINYLDFSRGRVITVKVSPLLPRPPIFVGADIFRLPIVAVSKSSPPSIQFIAPAPRQSTVDTSVESINVTLSEELGNNSATVKIVVDESIFKTLIGTQPIETALTGFPPEMAHVADLRTEIPYPSRLLYRRIVIETGYVMETPGGGVDGVLYPVFDGIITGISTRVARETATGRQLEVTIKAADIFTRLRWVPATGKDPILDNWTPGAVAMWVLAAAGLSPLRAKGISGLPMGAPLNWWLGNERIIASNLLGGYGFPLQNLPETPRLEMSGGSTLADILERVAGMSGCEVISLPSPLLLSHMMLNFNNLSFVWRGYLQPHEFDLYSRPTSDYISEQLIARTGDYWWSTPWRSTLGIIPAGYYSPIPSWTLMIGPYDYTNPRLIWTGKEERYFQVTVPEAPFTRGILEIESEDGIWNLPTYVTIEGLGITGVPFYYLWADINREVNPFAWYYGGFRIPKYVLNTDIISPQQAKLAALRAYFSGRLFPPKTLRIVLSVGLPFLYPRQTVRIVTSDKFRDTPPLGRSLWVIKSVTHTWTAGDTPKTVLELSVPHLFPIGLPQGER
ncbi:MAG: hypothetical protein RQ862_02170 [Candidatus Caldarchaeales archaeon]|nr:hypothetical protein [Candidatus Caldarchaeales archaeon]